MGISEAIYFVVFAGLLLWFIGYQSWVRVETFSANQIRFFFAVKIMVGIGFTLLYKYYYDDRGNSDAFKFYDDAMLLYQHFKTDPWSWFKLMIGVDLQDPKVVNMVDELNHWFKLYKRGMFNDNQTIIRFNALLMPITTGFYFVHVLIINFLSAFGMLALVKFFENWGVKNKWFFIGLLLFPQVIFWSSGLLKEGLLFSIFGWLLIAIQRVVFKISFKSLLVFCICVYLAFLIKNYVLIALLPGIIILFVHKKYPRISPLAMALGILMVGVSTAILFNSLFDLHIPISIYQKQRDFINEAELTKAGSYFHSFVLEPTWWGLIKNGPYAIWNCFVQPSVFNANNVLMWGAAFENLFIILAVIVVMIFPNTQFLSSDRAAFSILFILVILVIIGWVTPISGALVRYKIPAIPFMLFLFFRGTNWSRIQNLFQKS
ncbi:MAG: hypothetical protein KDC83_07975 [Flavobacteriales bacterium]|nr:hypothetical protein [Flavobacteriales bacterium]